jgi:hypothetical protein
MDFKLARAIHSGLARTPPCAADARRVQGQI